MLRNLIAGFVGAAVGGMFLDEEGVVPGFLVGLLFGVVLQLRQRVGELERRLGMAPEPTEVRRPAPAASRRPSAAESSAASEAGPDDASVESAAAAPPGPPPPSGMDDTDDLDWEIPPPPSDARRPATPPPAVRSIPESRPSPADEPESETPRWQTSIRQFLTGGNLVVRAGVVILFFGVAFLLKYAAERGMVPLEIRLAGVALGGIVLLGLGWRLRDGRKGYAVTLQGAGVGVLYLVLFTAARLYHLIPMGLTFALMVGLVVLSGVLAVLQDALPLAVFGALGGFLAPVLASTGRGSHVALFTYYALLNAGILQVAWYRSWRVLNLVGFFFTFGVATAWGLQYYGPKYYASVQPFLILFFLFYVAISVLFAHRLPVKLRGMVDGTLVFGLSIVAFALQARLVARFEYGLAFSALALSGFYVALATALWRRSVTGMRLLAEAFLSLGVVFGSVAIPLALDGRWTAAAWAMEGAALVWVGVRQNRAAARNFGLLLQLGAGTAFMLSAGYRKDAIPVINGNFLGGLTIAAAGLFSAAYLERNADRLRRWERGFHVVFLIWGLLWWLGNGAREIERSLTGSMREEPAFLALIALTALGLGWLCRKIRWRSAAVPAGMLLPVLILFVGGAWEGTLPPHAFAGWYGPAWVLALAAHLRLLFQFEARWRSGVVRAWHLGGALIAVFLIAWEISWWVDRLVEGPAWDFAVWGLLPATTALLLLGPARRIPWPVARQPEAYLGMAPAALVAWAAVWFLAAALHAGNPAPLPWIPVLNPLDLAQAFALVVAVVWLRAVRRSGYPALPPAAFRGFAFAVGFGGFLWCNVVVARTVHFWAGVAYVVEPLFKSDRFQAAVSILWSLFALGLMAAANRRGSRSVWIVGGALLGLVVAKLFFVDLAGSGTIPRIVSFLGVGALMLVIGFLSPLPPRREAAADEASAPDSSEG